MRKVIIVGVILSLLLIISSAVNAASGAKPTPGPNPQEQIQDSRLTNLETNDTAQQVNNTEQQTWISGLFNAITGINQNLALIVTRVTNLENKQSQTYVIGSPTNYISKTITPGTVQEIGNYQFYIPVDSYVYIEVSGSLIGVGDMGASDMVLTMLVDQDPVCSPTCYRNDGNYRKYYGPQGGYANNFEISSVRYLSGGTHTIYLAGAEYSTQNANVEIRGNFNIIASQNNGLTSQYKQAIQNPIEETTIAKTN